MKRISLSDGITTSWGSKEEAFSDEFLIRQVARGDEGAFEKLYLKHKKRIFCYLVRMLGDESTTEELTQEVFLAVYREARSFRLGSKFSTWLFTIAHNLGCKKRRRGLRYRRVEEIDSYPCNKTKESQIVAEKNCFASKIKEAIKRLPKIHQEVIELKYYQCMSCKEIAKVLRCPVGTVYSRLSYGLRRFKDILKEVGIDESWCEL